ncbi:MAG: inorganic phosphate transporter [Sphingomonas sp.]|uniref:inorganic phosphate transporter n=1 Tax=Sphingomonas sp. TaxID=28214 RepID=UPI003F814388
MGEPRPSSSGPRLDQPSHPIAKLVFAALIVGALGYAGYSILVDTQHVGEQMATHVFAFLIVALVIALGFEFVNGFHDTANAVATVIYTNSMPAPLAVVWSGAFNFLGVLLSSGAVAYTIVTLLPVDLILHVGSAGGYAMIFALLFAAVLWNLATWYIGLPNSSSHTLIGSVLGVGLANQLMTAGSKGGTAGVDWGQAYGVFSGLFWSPLIGFVGAFLLLFVMKAVIRTPALYREPERDMPPPAPIRALLVLTCTLVSFFHGSNDGQKGMGLIMLILIGCAPTAYALNRTMPASATAAFVESAKVGTAPFAAKAGIIDPDTAHARAALTTALQQRKADSAQVYGAIATLSGDVSRRIQGYGAISNIPAAATANLRNDMYLVLDTSRLVTKAKDVGTRFTPAEVKAIGAYQKNLESGTRYIPLWVKLAVAVALGLGTMVGWRRIVKTVGERIGKTHLTYGMGAAAELVAAATIAFADRMAVPVSTTHILTSGVAGSSLANRAGLQFRTIRNMVLAWVLTLPAAMALSGGLYWLLRQFVG